jgi:predicted RNase H-like HicB family nuclease
MYAEANVKMKLKVIIHEAEEGGYWAEVPAISGCATQGDTFEELLKNLYEAIEGCLSVDSDYSVGLLLPKLK